MKQIERLRELADRTSLTGPEMGEMWRGFPDLLDHIDALEARVEEAETIAGIATIPDVAGMAERLEAAERALAEAVEVLGVARIALLYARDTFSHYELQHLDKQTPEGNAKADANARHANHMSQALATISKITGEEGAGAFLTKRGEK